MKKIIYVIMFAFIGGILVSCENDDDKFTGSPLGNMDIETISGTISSDAEFALPGQEINFTASVPAEFRAIVTDTITVQATAYSMGGALRNASVDILPGQTSATEKITVPGGGGTFDLNFDLKLTAIALKAKSAVPGKHYLLTSNTLNIPSGNSGVPSTNDKRLKLSIDWENKTTINKLRVKIERVKLTTLTLRGTQGAGNIKIGTTIYPVTFSNDLETTAANFVAAQTAAISANHGIDIFAVGSDIQFKYYTDTPPVIAITPVGNGIRGDIYAEVNVGPVTDWPKAYFFAATKLGTTSEGTATATANSSYAYTPGEYRVKIGVNSDADLASAPLDLKYRLVLRYPNGDIKIYNGVYNNLSGTSGYKSVLTVNKTGLGDQTSYTDLFTP